MPAAQVTDRSERAQTAVGYLRNRRSRLPRAWRPTQADSGAERPAMREPCPHRHSGDIGAERRDLRVVHKLHRSQKVTHSLVGHPIRAPNRAWCRFLRPSWRRKRIRTSSARGRLHESGFLTEPICVGWKATIGCRRVDQPSADSWLPRRRWLPRWSPTDPGALKVARQGALTRRAR